MLSASKMSGAGIALLSIATIYSNFALLKNPPNHPENKPNASVYILGPSRSLVAQGLYKRADVYFHKGMPYLKEEAFQSFYQKWKDALCPKEHAHIAGNEVSEILPWLKLASQSDPHNIEIFLVASYWLNGECGRPDLAEQAILEAIHKNDNRHELYVELARIHLSSSEYARALDQLQQALQIMQGNESEDLEQATIDKQFIFVALSYLYEAEKLNDPCLHITRDLVQISPTQANNDRLEQLEIGNFDPEAAKARLNELFYKEHQCDREHEHGPNYGCPDDGHDTSHDAHSCGTDCAH